MSESTHSWWGELRHGGMLIAPALLEEFYPELPELDRRAYERLRSSWIAAEGSRAPDRQEARRTFVTSLLEGSVGLRGWQKAAAVGEGFKAISVAGDRLRPSSALPAANGGASLVLQFDEADRVGIGRGRRSHARLVELMRRTGVPIGLLTNGRQLRVIHAGPDYDAWAEWDAATWFDESEGRDTLRRLHALLGARDGDADSVTGRLADAVRASRDRQGDLAQVLGEQVRRAVELLVAEVDAELKRDAELARAVWADPQDGEPLADDEAHAALFQAATRVVMRLVLILYAESRDLLPASVEAYHDSYGAEGLYRVLAEADRDGSDGALGAAWQRLLGLFRLIHGGSSHPDLPVRAYGGQLFRSGDLASTDPLLRALAALERVRPADRTVYRLLRLLKIGQIKVRAGRTSRWVAGPVDFSDLRTEYIGIVYEGLLDYWLHLVDDYPLHALEREGGDGRSGEKTTPWQTTPPDRSIANCLNSHNGHSRTTTYQGIARPLWCLGNPTLLCCQGVGWYFAEALVEVAGESASDAAACFSAGFAGCEESLVVAGGLGVVVGPLECDDVEDPAELAVAAAVEAVPSLVAA